jgi:small-conductance mechanosensitive channel
VLFGILAARFVGGVVASGSAAAGVGGAARLGLLVQGAVVALVSVVAIEQLGIATQVLVGPLTALVGAAGLAAGLAFALGARPIVTHILAGHFLKQSLPRDSFVEVAGRRGIVERIGATDTLLRNGDERWSIPNQQLLEQVVGR